MDSYKIVPVLIVAGEPSGDKNAGLFVKKIKNSDEKIKFIGFGGKEMEKAGVEIIEDITEHATVGFFELRNKIMYYRGLYKKILTVVRERKIKNAVLVDFPGFNLHLARALKKRKVKVFYYVVPQIWAWGGWRWKEMKKYVDISLCILPFEENFLRSKGLNAFYVGHPIISTRNEKIENSSSLIRDKKDKKVIAFLPGSREREIKALVPVMQKIKDKLQKKLKNTEFYISLFTVSEKIREKIPLQGFKIFKGDVQELLSFSDAAIVASGTASLEVGLKGIPFLVLYKLSPLTYFLGRLLVKVKYASLVNLLLEEKNVPEFIQFINPEKVVKVFLDIYDKKEKYEHIKTQLFKKLSDNKIISLQELFLSEIAVE